MKTRKTILAISYFLLIVVVSLFLPCGNTETKGATHASSYTNAREFFLSTGDDDGKHIDVVGGNIYFATRGWLANTYSVDYYTYYDTVGWDIQLSAGGETLLFSVKNGVSLKQVPGSSVNKTEESGGTWAYRLYHITADSLETLAKKADPEKAERIFKSDVIGVRMDSIVIRSYAGMKGSIEEDDFGGLNIYRPNNDYEWVWRIKDEEVLNDLNNTFSNQHFEEDHNVKAVLENYKLNIYYGVDGTPEMSATSSTHVTVNEAKDYSTKHGKIDGKNMTYYVLFEENKPYIQTDYVVNSMTLLVPDSDDANIKTPNMKKTGYHLDKGKEWIREDKDKNKATFAAGQPYRPTALEPNSAYKESNLCLYANWQPNEYQIVYHANGGDGTMGNTDATYDGDPVTLTKNIFTKKGNLFAGWATSPTGDVVYSDMQGGLKNLTDEHEGKVNLYAVWVPDVSKITLDKQGGTGGTDLYFQEYENGNYEEKDCENEILEITEPEKKGNTFKGYFTFRNGKGTQYITEDGKIDTTKPLFIGDTVLYASWEPRSFTVTLDKQGGIYGSDTVIATYEKRMPEAEAPVRSGCIFQGYYTKPNGEGVCYYDKEMNSNVVYKNTQNMALYAHWEDVEAPDCVLKVSADTWTNETVMLTAVAEDYGSGLDGVRIYRIEEDGTLHCVAEKSSLGGANRTELSFANEREGVVRYKAVAIDRDGNVSESYNTVYYDKTPPTGEIIECKVQGDCFYFNLIITDGNAGD